MDVDDKTNRLLLDNLCTVSYREEQKKQKGGKKMKTQGDALKKCVMRKR